MDDLSVVHVAVPGPAFDSFDYLRPPSSSTTNPPLRLGTRVLVGFGDRRVVGMIVGGGQRSRVPAKRLRPVLKVLDTEPILDRRDLELLQWVSRYYHYPLGEVVKAALPTRLRQGNEAAIAGTPVWRISPDGHDVPLESLRRAPRQAALLALLKTHPDGLDAAQISATVSNWRQPLARLLEKRLVEETSRPCLEAAHAASIPAPNLNAYQTAAVDSMLDALGRFTPFVLEGVTGSGKTEVYLKLIEQALLASRQALVLVPEIALTPQLIARFRARFSVPLAVMHSALSDGERHCAWHMARVGAAPIVIGTRSAVFTPLAAPGVFVVDEEHDSSFKQQEGFRYHARDVAVFRARLLGIPVILGSATPSLETLYNVQRGRYRRVRLPERARRAGAPTLEVVDVRRCAMDNGLSSYVLTQVQQHLKAGDQVLVFLNRRGYAPLLLCHDCGWAASCARCDAKLTLHAAKGRLCCHHCGAERPVNVECSSCGSTALLRIGEGTERIEQALKKAFPDVSIVRIDRDSTRRKGDLQKKLTDIEGGAHRLLIGTQMLSKGHDFPNVTLAVILNIDHSLYSSDFRAAERAAQLIVQVAGRAGRGDRPGKVILQTHRPDQLLLNNLVEGGYEVFSRMALKERRLAGLPPYRHLALLRAEATRQEASLNFLRGAQALLSANAASGVSILGPAPAPMERRAGRYRFQLLLSAQYRTKLQRLLDNCIPSVGTLPSARSVRWTLDVDPIEML
ncbi:MAG TPA: primosomal protein N' [Gammaproteobacteria bacterium]|nr:primosomal protein N' [Gammaproteobacteria bacterium]